MNKFKLFVVAMLIMMVVTSIAFADDTKISVQLNGEYLSFVDEQGNEVLPQIINDRTMVPLRKIFESLDCKIDWEQSTKTVTATKDNTEIVLTIDNEIAKVKDLNSNETKEITLDSVPVIVDNRTLVPVRFIAESLDKSVSWEQSTKTVIIIDYNRLLNEFKARVPNLQKIFDLKLGEFKSYRTTGSINATLNYEDKEDSSKNEKIDIKGTIETIFSGKDLQIDIKAKLSGKDGSIMNSIKSSGSEEFNYRFVLKNGKTYLGKYNGRIYEWQEGGIETYLTEDKEILGIPASDLDFTKMGDITFDSYDSILAFVTEKGVGSETYGSLLTFFDVLGIVFSDDNVKVTTSGSKTTVSFNFDLSKVLLEVIPDISESTLSAVKLTVSTSLVVNNDMLSSEKITLDFTGDSEETQEVVGFKATIDTKYKDVNKILTVDEPSN